MAVRGKGCADAAEIVTVTFADLEIEAAQAFMQGVHRRDRVRRAEALQPVVIDQYCQIIEPMVGRKDRGFEG